MPSNVRHYMARELDFVCNTNRMSKHNGHTNGTELLYVDKDLVSMWNRTNPKFMVIAD